MTAKMINRIIFVLSLIGMGVAAYVAFTWLTGSPIVCISGGCETVRKNTLAWPLGIPFPLFGFIGYTLIAILAFLKTIKTSWKTNLNKGILGMTIFGVCLVTYFTFLETFIIKGYCMWCVISTIIMYVNFYLALKMFRLKT